MDALPPKPPAEIRQVGPDYTPYLSHVEVFVGALPTETKHQGHHHHNHAPGTRLVAQTSTSTDGARVILIAAPDHLEHAVDAASDEIAAEFAKLKDIYVVNGQLMQVYRIR
jgi:hypothetical protein